MDHSNLSAERLNVSMRLCVLEVCKEEKDFNSCCQNSFSLRAERESSNFSLQSTDQTVRKQKRTIATEKKCSNCESKPKQKEADISQDSQFTLPLCIMHPAV